MFEVQDKQLSKHVKQKWSNFWDQLLICLTCPLIGHGHSAAKKLTSVLNMTQPISQIAWKRHTKAITDAAVNVSNNSMKKAAFEAK